MAAYALARIQYKPKFGNILMFVALTLVVIVATSYVGVPWWASAAVALALFFFLARAFGKHFKRTRSAMATSCSGSSPSASCRRSSWSFRST